MLVTMKREYFVLAAIALCIAFFALRAPALPRQSSAAAPEIAKILSLSSPKAQSAELEKLLDKVGATEAQDALLKSGLPFTGETHLLVHTIGNWIYKQYGPAGLSYCKDYFLSACYHAFILNDLADHGLDGMVEVMADCAKAGPAVLPQCAHGAGHGFVAWHDYDLLKALAMCDELGSKSPHFPYYNCYDGVFMENFWGIHSGAPSPKRWVSDTDIYYPCTDPRIPSKYLNACWGNQATSLYQHFKGDFKKTAQACDAVLNESYRNSCYDNFARQINPVTRGDVRQVLSLCGLATGTARQNECVLTNMSAFWGVGDRKTPYAICAAMAPEAKDGCYSRLLNLIRFYYSAQPEEKKTYCAKLSEPWQTQCES
jgi:hypothetical protein